MKKQVILLSLIVSVVAGAVTAMVITATNGLKGQAEKTIFLNSTDKADSHFVSYGSPREGILPDLTYAAEIGVKAVVNVESVKKIQVQSRGNSRQWSPFEFFFGPGSGYDGYDEQPMPREREQSSGGSGVIISSDGYIVSNNHVVDGADELRITLNDGTQYAATVVGTDPSTDIALLKIDAKDLNFLNFGDSDDLKLGEWVLAVGNPYGLTSTVTAGIISAKGRSLGILGRESQLGVESFIQTDAAVNPGNSGGALMTTDGRLIGINTVIKSPTGTFAGYSFAVPSSIARKVVGDIREYGVVQRALLGISMVAVKDWANTEEGKKSDIKDLNGVHISGTAPNGAAAAAGIKEGDIITSIDGNAMNSASELQEYIAMKRPNDKIKVTLKRDGSVKQFDVTLRNTAGETNLISKDDTSAFDRLGGTFQDIGDRAKKEFNINHGVHVTGVKPGGILAKMKIHEGFIITTVNDTPITTVTDLYSVKGKIESLKGIDGRTGERASFRSME